MKDGVGDFTPEDLRQIPNHLSVIRQVTKGPTDQLHDGWFGLGLPVAFKEIINAADMGCLSIGPPGVGKTTSMMAIKTINHKAKLYDTDKTLASLGSKQKDKVTVEGQLLGDQEYFNNSPVLWMSYDFARLSEMHQVNMLKVVCALLTEHEIKTGTLSYELSIVNCDLSWLGACTYEDYGELWESRLWRGNFRDRIARFHQMVYKRPFVNEAVPEPRITLNFPKLKDVKLEAMDGYHEVEKMLRSQFTGERAPIWASRLGRASAAINHRTTTTMADWKFLLLFRLNFEVERMVGWRQTMTGPLNIDADALMILSEVMKAGRTTPEAIMEEYLISDREQFMATIKDSIGSLLDRGPGGTLVPGEDLLHDYVLPQTAFEIFCLHRGPEFYQNGDKK